MRPHHAGCQQEATTQPHNLPHHTVLPAAKTPAKKNLHAPLNLFQDIVVPVTLPSIPFSIRADHARRVTGYAGSGFVHGLVKILYQRIEQVLYDPPLSDDDLAGDLHAGNNEDLLLFIIRQRCFINGDP